MSVTSFIEKISRSVVRLLALFFLMALLTICFIYFFSTPRASRLSEEALHPNSEASGWLYSQEGKQELAWLTLNTESDSSKRYWHHDHIRHAKPLPYYELVAKRSYFGGLLRSWQTIAIGPWTVIDSKRGIIGLASPATTTSYRDQKAWHLVLLSPEKKWKRNRATILTQAFSVGELKAGACPENSEPLEDPRWCLPKKSVGATEASKSLQGYLRRALKTFGKAR